MDAAGANLGVSLSALLPQRRFYQATDIRVSSCCTNPSLCRQGDLFVASVDADGDGHDGAVEATQRGISAVLCERLLPLDIPQCVVPNARAALATICQGLAGFPSHTLPVVGVAGSSGLTTCELLFERILEKAGYAPAGFNSLHYTNGFDPVPRIGRSTSTAQHAQWLASSLANGCSHAVLELPRKEVVNHTYDATRLSALMLTQLRIWGQRLAVTPATEHYFQTVLRSLDTDGLLVANVDCPLVAELLGHVERPVLTVSAQGAAADLTATLLERGASEQTFMLQAGYDTVAVRSKIIHESHVQACLLATATALSQGIDLPTIVQGLESVQSVPGHLERVECGQPFSVFTDGAVTSAELHQALHNVRQVTRGKVICVFGPGLARQAKLRWRRGRLAERFADLPIITSDDPLDAQPLRTTHDVLDGFQRPAAAHVMPNRMHAIEWALTQCQPGDSLLLAGPHNRILTRTEDDYPADSDTARYWLYELGSRDVDWLLPRG